MSAIRCTSSAGFWSLISSPRLSAGTGHAPSADGAFGVHLRSTRTHRSGEAAPAAQRRLPAGFAYSSTPPLSRQAVIPVARNEWLPIGVRMPAAAARRRIMRQASGCSIGCSVNTVALCRGWCETAESLACISQGLSNRSLFESLRDRHQEAGHAYRNDEAGLADRN